MKLHVFLEQRVGAHRYVRQPFGQQFLELRLLAAREGAGEQQRDVAQLGQNLLEVDGVLRGQDLGGRQHRHLVAVFDGDHRRFRRHDGFAAAHVAL